MVTHAVVILAGGRGSRMQSSIQKPLIPVQQIPMITHLIRAFRAAGVNQVIVVSNLDNQEKYRQLPGVDLVVTQTDPLGTFHAVQTAFSSLNHPYTFVTPADKPCLQPRTIRKMMQYQSHSILAYQSQSQKPTLVCDENLQLRYIQEDPTSPEFYQTHPWRTGGVYCFKTEELTQLRLDHEITKENKQGEYYLTDVFPHFSTPTQLIPIDDPSEISNVNTPEDHQTVSARFPDSFSHQSLHARAHGRLNLMGRHIDHQGGFNNLILLPQFVEVTLTPTSALYPLLQITRLDRQLTCFYDLSCLPQIPEDWSQYSVAAIVYLRDKLDLQLPPCHLTIDGNIPQGAGLSSSSAVVVATMKAILAFHDQQIAPETLVEMAGAAEKLIGTGGGLGDHAAMLLGEEGQVVQVLTSPQVKSSQPFDLPSELEIYLFHSGVEAHKGSECQQRFNHKVNCYHEGFKLLQKKNPEIKTLVDLSNHSEELLQDLPEEIGQVMTYGLKEYRRSERFMDCCQKNDLVQIGQDVRESMLDEQNLYGCSCPEVDQLVDEANQIPGVLGSQICGAGMGGSVAVFAQRGSVVTKILSPKYRLISRI